VPFVCIGALFVKILQCVAEKGSTSMPLSARFPDVAATLKQELLKANASVLADAPDGHLAQGHTD